MTDLGQLQKQLDAARKNHKAAQTRKDSARRVYDLTQLRVKATARIVAESEEVLKSATADLVNS